MYDFMEMPDLDMIKQAYGRQNQAANQVQFLQQERERALKDADFEIKPDQMSPLGAIAMIMRREQGQEELDKLKPQLKQALAKEAEGKSVREGEVLRQALANERMNQMGVQQRGRQLDLTRRGQDLTYKAQANSVLNQGDVQEWDDAEGNAVARTISTMVDNKPVLIDADTGQPMDPGRLEGLTKRPPRYAGGGRGKALSGSERTEITNKGSHVRDLAQLSSNMGDHVHLDTIGNLPSKKLAEIQEGLATGNWLEWAGANGLQDVTEETARWWSGVRMQYILPERHTLFGSALTETERASWEQALNMNPAMNKWEIMARFREIERIQLRNYYRVLEQEATRGYEADRPIYKALLDQETASGVFPTREDGSVDIAKMETSAYLQGYSVPEEQLNEWVAEVEKSNPGTTSGMDRKAKERLYMRYHGGE